MTNMCKGCNKVYKHPSGLSRHKKSSDTCKNIYIASSNDEVKSRKEYETVDNSDIKPFDYDAKCKMLSFLNKKYNKEYFLIGKGIISAITYDYLVDNKYIKLSSKRDRSFKIRYEGKIIIDKNLDIIYNAIYPMVSDIVGKIFCNLLDAEVDVNFKMDTYVNAYSTFTRLDKDRDDFYYGICEFALEDPLKIRRYRKKIALFFENELVNASEQEK
jgi:hypothetical protein